jgi:tetratricopeptide (TPR) repeat protein
MIVSLSSAAARGALVGVALAIAAYLSYFSVQNARATYYTDPATLYGFERATQIEPGDARNWYLLGRYLQYSFEDANPQRAISSYKRSLEINPRGTSTWLELAATYESEGNDVAARNAFISAKKTYPLSAEVSWRYGNFLLRQGELEPAFAEIRRSVEADPGRASEAVSRCLRVEPDANVILDRVLPRKSEIYMAVLGDLAQDRQIDNALKVWTRIVAMHPKIALHDAFQLVMDLRGNGQTAEAHKVWEQAVELAGLSQLEGPSNSMVWDGGFESDVTDGEAFAWRFARTSRSAQIGFDTQEKYSGKRSLRVSFDGSADVAFYDVCQTVPTEAGTAYELSGWMKSKDLTTDQGVHIELRPGIPGTTGAITADVRGTQPWARFAAVWPGSKEDQETQICLRRDASDQEDNKIRGTAWVDDVALTPIPRSGVKQ